MWFLNYGNFCNKRSTDHESQKILPAVNLTLENLQLDYLDLYLVIYILKDPQPSQERSNWTTFVVQEGMDFRNMERNG